MEDTYTINIETKKNNEKELFKILDTAGEEDYQNMLDQWISLASGFLLVFAINDMETFKALDSKFKRIQKNEAEKLPIILVGNKCDLTEEREVSVQEAEEFAKTIKAKYYETSALTDFNGNCKVVFQECANLILNVSKDEGKKKGGCMGCGIF